MAACNFNIDFQGQAAEVLASAKTMVEKVNGSFDGNEDQTAVINSSYPWDRSKGKYTVSGQTITFQITREANARPMCCYRKLPA